MTNKTELNKALDGVREKFVFGLKGNFPKYKELYLSVSKEEEVSQTLLEELCYISHKVSGSAKTFGFEKIGVIADEVEYVIESVLGNIVNRDNALKDLENKIASFLRESKRIIEEEANYDRQQKAEEEDKEFNARCKILAVDDDPLIGELLKRCLKGVNIWVDFITDSEKVFETIDDKQPQVVILDVNMPKLSGFDILKKMKSDSKTKDIPVIMLTKRNKDVDQIEGFSSGADDYITKPFDIDILIISILEVVQRNFPE